VLEHDPSVDPYVNDTIALHAVIHRYNPQIVALAHTHPPAAVSWGTFRRLPEIYDQESCILAGDVALWKKTIQAQPPAKTVCGHLQMQLQSIQQ